MGRLAATHLRLVANHRPSSGLVSRYGCSAAPIFASFVEAEDGQSHARDGMSGQLDRTRVRGRCIIALPHGTGTAKKDEFSLADSRQYDSILCALVHRGLAHPITAPAARDITAGVPETVEISSLLGGLERCVAVVRFPQWAVGCPCTTAGG